MGSSELCERWVETARRLLAVSPEADLVAAFVFGSAAWGDAGETSDVDIMVLLGRDDDFREVTRVRVSELVSMSPPAPLFADIDRVSFERFQAAIGKGNWHYRVVNSVVLADDGRYEAIRRQVSAGFASAEERARRARKHEETAGQHVRAAAQARAGDPSLALLHARLAAEEAGIALLKASGNRLSAGHYFDALDRALTVLDQGSLVIELQRALALNCGRAGVQRGLDAYRVIAEALRRWMQDPVVAAGLGPEHVAWATFTYAAESFEEFTQKVEALLHVNRGPEAVAYVDGLLKVPLRMNVSRVLNLRSRGTRDILSIADFHVGLRSELALYSHWAEGLRLDGNSSDSDLAVDVAGRLLACLPQVLAAPLTGSTAPTH
jgi:predicted nucleotidyltransferase